jgi:hypothetical protein
MRIRDFIDIVERASSIDPILNEDAIPLISPQQARERKLFGPVYHGTQNIDAIMSQGFSLARAEDGRANGYPFSPYVPSGSIPAPVHHLGFGVYFTTEKANAKRFNGDSVKGLKEFWLDVPRLETINFGSPNTMMRWWNAHGYHPSNDILRRHDTQEWIAQTRALTDNLSSQWDAVWFKGKGMRRLLDGDQICVYDPDRIYVADPRLAQGLEIGAKVVHTQTVSQYRGRNEFYLDTIDHDSRFQGWHAVFRAVDWDGNEVSKENARPLHFVPPPGMIGTIVDSHEGKGPREGKTYYSVKWAKGGVQHNYTPDELAPAPSKGR